MPAKRFEETVNIRQQSLDTGFSKGANSLSNRLERFQNVQHQATSKLISVAGKEAEERGRLSGENVPIERKDGVTQKPKFKEKKFIGNIEITAHNKALRAAYIAGIDNDTTENIEKMALENPTDLPKLNDLMEGYKSGILKSVDSSIMQAVTIDLDNKMSAARARVQKNVIEKDSAIAKGTLMTALERTTLSASRAAFEGDNMSAAEYMAKSKRIAKEMFDAGYMTLEKKEKYLLDADREVSEQVKRRELDLASDKSISDGEALINQWEDKIPKGWSPDEWKAFTKSARTDLNYKKQVFKTRALEESNLTERLLFSKLLKNELTETDLLNAKLDTEGKRTKWFSILSTRTSNALSAKRALEIEQRGRRNDLYTQQTRVKAAAQTAEELELDNLYSKNELTENRIASSTASTPVKRQYRTLIEKRAKVAIDDAEILKKDMAENEILLNIGNWEDPELDTFLLKGLTADEVYQWKQRNNEVKNDPNNFKNDVVYKAGMKDLVNAKTNYLFIGGEETGDLTEDNKNTQRYLEVVEQYKLLSSEPGADYAKILNDLKRPYLEDLSKGWMDKFFSAIKAQNPAFDLLTRKKEKPENLNVLSEKTDEEILKMIGK